MLPSEGIFYLDKSKKHLEKAPGFDKSKTPDIGDMRWGAEIHRHYQDNYVYYNDYGYGYYDGCYGPSIGQWEDDPNTKIFDPNTITTIEGKLVKVEPVLEPGVGMTLQLLVYSGRKEIHRVYLGPSWYIASGGERRFKAGDEVTVSGSQVTLKNDLSVIATTVNWRNEILQLRNNDGVPAWAGWKKK